MRKVCKKDFLHIHLYDEMTFKPKTGKRKDFDYYMAMPKSKRKSMGVGNMRELCNYLGIAYMTGWRWSKEYKQEDEGGKDLQEFMQKLWDSKSPSDRRLYADIQGYVKKSEEKVGKVEFTADDYTRIGRELIERLRREHQEGGGNCPLCGESKVFRQEARLDSQSDDTENREVATLELST